MSRAPPASDLATQITLGDCGGDDGDFSDLVGEVFGHDVDYVTLAEEDEIVRG